MNEMMGKQIREWIFLEEIGRGGMGLVYKVRHALVPEQLRAIKIIHAEMVWDEEIAARFLREASVMLSLKHENLTEAETPFMESGRLYVVMEFLEGNSLQEWIDRYDKLGLSLAFGIALQAAKGLGYAHSREISHRDIKPSNIFIENSGNVKILDFGLARRSADIGVTRSGNQIGTIEYMPPEVFHPYSQRNPKGLKTPSDWLAVSKLRDVYALGLVLYEMLSGSLPFKLDADIDVMKQIQTMTEVHRDRLPPIEQFRFLPPFLAGIVNKAVHRDPMQRYADSEQFAHDLKKAARMMFNRAEYIG